MVLVKDLPRADMTDYWREYKWEYKTELRTARRSAMEKELGLWVIR